MSLTSTSSLPVVAGLSAVQAGVQRESSMSFEQFCEHLRSVLINSKNAKNATLRRFHTLWETRVDAFMLAAEGMTTLAWRGMAEQNFTIATRESARKAAEQRDIMRNARYWSKASSVPGGSGAGAGAAAATVRTPRSSSQPASSLPATGGASPMQGRARPNRRRLPQGMDSGQRRRAGSSRGPIQCYQCGVLGHTARECTSAPRRCRLCGGVDHTAESCPRPAAGAQ